MKSIFITLILLFSIKIYATGQQTNIILIEGKEYRLLNDPLETYLQKHSEIKLRQPDYDEDGNEILVISTGNWRGYIAYFQIENNELVLYDVKTTNFETNETTSVYQKIFGNEKTKMDYSGILTVANGEFISSDNFEYSHYFTHYILFTFQNNHVVKSKKINNDEYIKFKIKRFLAYSKTDDYKREYQNYLDQWKENKKWELSKNNLKNLSKNEISELKKQYATEPSKKEIDNFLFMMRPLDNIIVAY